MIKVCEVLQCLLNFNKIYRYTSFDGVNKASKTQHERKLTILLHSLREENKELMVKSNLSQTRLSHVSESNTFQLYQNAQVNQDTTVLLVCSKNIKSQSKELNKFEQNFAEGHKKINSLEVVVILKYPNGVWIVLLLYIL